MLSHWLDRLGDWNPQLWREVKQRVNLRSFLATTAASLLEQWWLVRDLGAQAESLTQNSGSSESTTQSHLVWQAATLNLVTTLTWLALWLLMVAGSYLLAKNLLREIRRGTLTFLRLSSYSAGKILLGKVLGVPILLHWAIVLALPLQLWAAIQAGQVSATIVADGTIMIFGGAFYAATIQSVMEWGKRTKPWLLTIAANIFYLPCGVIQAFVVIAWLEIERSITTGVLGTGTIPLSVAAMAMLLFLVAISLTCWRLCIRMFNCPDS